MKGRAIAAGCCQRAALVSNEPLSFLGCIDYNSGVIVEKGNDLNGESVKDKVLHFPNGHGSMVGSYVLYSCRPFTR